MPFWQKLCIVVDFKLQYFVTLLCHRMTPIERMFFILQKVHCFLFRPKNTKEEEIRQLSNFLWQFDRCSDRRKKHIMVYLMEIEPNFRPPISYPHMVDITEIYLIAEKSDFIMSWLKKRREMLSWVNFEWFNDHNNQMTFLLSQIEDRQKGDLIVRLVWTSGFEFVDTLKELVYKKELVGLSGFDEYYDQIHSVPQTMIGRNPASEILRLDTSPTVRRIKLIRQQLESRMSLHMDEIQQHLNLEALLELERLGGSWRPY